MAQGWQPFHSCTGRGSTVAATTPLSNAPTTSPPTYGPSSATSKPTAAQGARSACAPRAPLGSTHLEGRPGRAFFSGPTSGAVVLPPPGPLQPSAVLASTGALTTTNGSLSEVVPNPAPTRGPAPQRRPHHVPPSEILIPGPPLEPGSLLTARSRDFPPRDTMRRRPPARSAPAPRQPRRQNPAIDATPAPPTGQRLVCYFP